MKALINDHWLKPENMAALALSLQSGAARELTFSVATRISGSRKLPFEEAGRLFLKYWTATADSFITAVYREIHADIKAHAFHYPMKLFPATAFCSLKGRKVHEGILRAMRALPLVSGAVRPGEIKDSLPRIILPGVDYTAESIVQSGLLKSPELYVDKDALEWMKKDAKADFCLGVVAFGSEDFEDLTQAWVYGEVSSVHGYVDALDTLMEEVLHGCADQIAKIPRYGEKDVVKEHYWMNEYGAFPETVFTAIAKHSRSFIGSMKNLIEK